MNIHWYPGHMTKARRQLQAKLKLIDIVIEVLDARAPNSSLNPDFDDMFAQKEKIYILNKSDLADPTITQQWVDYYKGQDLRATEFSIYHSDVEKLKDKIVHSGKNLLAKYKKKEAKKTLRALVVGIPNVGKSAIINSLAGQKRLNVGNKPGVTKGLQWVKIDTYLEIMDSPGLLWPKFSDEETAAVVALIGSIKTDVLDEEELCYFLIKHLMRTAPQMLLERYNLGTVADDPFIVMEDIATRRGFLRKGGILDTERTAKTVLAEFRDGKLGRLSLESPEEIDYETK